MRIVVLFLVNCIACSAVAAQQPNISRDFHCKPFAKPQPQLDAWIKDAQKLITKSRSKDAASSYSKGKIASFVLKVKPSGSISTLNIRQSSGDVELDELYAERIRKASPFAPAPKLELSFGKKTGITKVYTGPFLVSIANEGVQVQTVKGE